jgi:hypothetical protein
MNSYYNRPAEPGEDKEAIKQDYQPHQYLSQMLNQVIHVAQLGEHELVSVL